MLDQMDHSGEWPYWLALAKIEQREAEERRVEQAAKAAVDSARANAKARPFKTTSYQNPLI